MCGKCSSADEKQNSYHGKNKADIKMIHIHVSYTELKASGIDGLVQMFQPMALQLCYTARAICTCCNFPNITMYHI